MRKSVPLLLVVRSKASRKLRCGRFRLNLSSHSPRLLLGETIDEVVRVSQDGLERLRNPILAIAALGIPRRRSWDALEDLADMPEIRSWKRPEDFLLVVGGGVLRTSAVGELVPHLQRPFSVDSVVDLAAPLSLCSD